MVIISINGPVYQYSLPAWSVPETGCTIVSEKSFSPGWVQAFLPLFGYALLKGKKMI